MYRLKLKFEEMPGCPSMTLGKEETEELLEALKVAFHYMRGRPGARIVGPRTLSTLSTTLNFMTDVKEGKRD